MRIRNLLMITLLGLLLHGLSGCSSFARTSEERAHMYKTVTWSELQMMMDDIDYINMVDRRSRLTRWH